MGQTKDGEANAGEVSAIQHSNPALAGLAAYDAGDYQRAAELLTRALDEFPLPTVAYYAARAHVELGQWTEAAELYRQATILPPKGTGAKLQTQQEAQELAQEELAALQARIPRITLHAPSSRHEAVSVTLDQTSLPASALGQPVPVNPGEHQVVRQCNDRPPVSLAVTVREGENARVVVSCEETDQEPGGADDRRRRPLPRLVPTMGWTAVGVGSAAWGGALVTGLLARRELSELEDDGTCNEDHACRPGSAGELKSYRSLRTTSTVAFWSGGALLAAGVTALLWDRSHGRAPASPREVRVQVGPTSVGIQGRF